MNRRIRLQTAVFPAFGAEQATPGGPVLVLLHGRTEFMDKYIEVIPRFTQAGYTVATFDWRGQGRSSRITKNPHRGHISRFDHYLDDLDGFLAQIVAPLKPSGLYLLAHSMGGHIALRHMLERPALRGDAPWPWRAAVLTAPMLALHLPKPVQRLAHFLGRLAKSTGFSRIYAPGMGDYRRSDQKFEGNMLTSDRARFERMHEQIAAAPMLATGGATIGWLHQALLSIDRLHRRAQRLKTETPILIFSSREDKVVDPSAHAAIAATQPNVNVVPLDRCRHEPLQECDAIYERVIAETLAHFARYGG